MSEPIFVPGQPPITDLDTKRLLQDAFNADLASATRRYMQEGQRAGFHFTEAEARDAVTDLYRQGDTDLLPQYHAISKRLKGAR